MGSFNDPFIAVAGAGLSGALAAVYLAQMGFNVHLFERRVDMRKEEISAGRSINLALSARGLFSLAEVGIDEEIMKISLPMFGRLIHAQSKAPLEFQSYSKDGKQSIRSVSRGDLNKALLTLAEKHGTKIHFSSPITKVDRHTGEITVSMGGDEAPLQLKPLATIGADGAFSAVRSALVRSDRTDYSQTYLKHGYKELCIPPSAEAQEALAAAAAAPPLEARFRTEYNGLHIWPRGSFMLIALPNMDGSFTVTLFMPYQNEAEPENSFDRLQSREQIEQFFATVFPDAPELMPNLFEDYQENPTGSLVTVRCFPWSLPLASPFTLVGDACHAIVPFFGQGMNAALQDVAVLARCIREHVLGAAPGLSHREFVAKKSGPPAASTSEKWYAAFSAYEQLQKRNADAIADMAIENYVEMRDSTADADFVFRKEVEHRLGTMYPNRFIGRYELVSFTTMPYADAYARGATNEEILRQVTKSAGRDMSKVDFDLAEKLINKHFPTAAL